MKKVFISMACVLIALSGCTNGGSNKESMEVVLNIKRKVKPECVSALKESFLKCKESTLLEPGCIDYGMYQSLTDSTEFFIAETWKNDGELQKHGETAHLKQHLNEIGAAGLVAFFVIQVLPEHLITHFCPPYSSRPCNNGRSLLCMRGYSKNQKKSHTK